MPRGRNNKKAESKGGLKPKTKDKRSKSESGQMTASMVRVSNVNKPTK